MSETSSLTVLVADDNAAARAQIVAILEDIGHEAVAVADGTEAVSALGALSFDLAVLDFDMPAPNGGDVAHRIEGKLPVIGLSSAGVSRDEWGDAPLAEWISKPVHAGVLAKAIQRLTSGEATMGRAGEAPVDLAHLATYTGGDHDLESELAELFSASCARYFEEMANARDDRVWQDAAHGMKGAARGIGANEVGRLAAFAEKLVGQAQAARRAETLTQLRAAAERVNIFFAEHLKG